jgi:hypothetical protein
MAKLDGKMKNLHVDSVKKDLKHYASVVDETARKTEKYSVEIALEIENLKKNANQLDLSLDKLNEKPTTIEDDFGNKLLKKAEPVKYGSLLNFAFGCERVPVTEEVVKQFVIYERLKPSMVRMYDDVENIDGVFLFDTESNIMAFRSEYDFGTDFDLPGMDMIFLHDLGIIWYDWFKYADQENNPERRGLWYPEAFIAVEHDWIMNFQAPIYRDRYMDTEKMVGVVAVHYNLDWMVSNTIENSAVKMMIVNNDSILIGVNNAAKKDIPLVTFDKSIFNDMSGVDPATTQFKKKHVGETLNLTSGKGEDVVAFASKLKSENQFQHTLFGKDYTVIQERSPELGLNFVALLDRV